MDTTVADIMRRKFVALKRTDRLADAIDVFIKNPDMVFPVIDKGGRVIGEVNQHEMLKLAVPARYVDEDEILGPSGIRELLEHEGKRVADVMTTHDIKVKAGTRVIEAAKIMLDTEVRTLEVIDDGGNPLGFVSELDILKYLKKKLQKRK